jgi:hypothetical protein
MVARPSVLLGDRFGDLLRFMVSTVKSPSLNRESNGEGSLLFFAKLDGDSGSFLSLSSKSCDSVNTEDFVWSGMIV